MKLKLWSDMHLEFSDHKYEHIWTPSPEDKETILLLAGDIDVGISAQDFMVELCDHFKHVIRICGNHEFYYNEFEKVISDWQEFELNGPKNFHFLHNDCRILDGVRFLGGTMWTSLNDGDYMSMAYAHRTMNDYVEIRSHGKRITPEFTIKQHDDFINFLLKNFDEYFDGPTVVMTHHSPGNGLKLKGRHDRADASYFADIEHMIGYHDKAVLWVHGHTHRNWDYMINNTRVVCNPYGYHGYSLNRTFNKDLILEV